MSLKALNPLTCPFADPGKTVDAIIEDGATPWGEGPPALMAAVLGSSRPQRCALRMNTEMHSEICENLAVLPDKTLWYCALCLPAARGLEVVWRASRARCALEASWRYRNQEHYWRVTFLRAAGLEVRNFLHGAILRTQ